MILWAKRVAALLATFLHSAEQFLAEWAGMHKRIEIIVRNLGYEGTENAMGSLSLDFEDENALKRARERLRMELQAPQLKQALIIENERGQELGFNPHHYSSHRIDDATDEWRPTWVLPETGIPPPPRES